MNLQFVKWKRKRKEKKKKTLISSVFPEMWAKAADKAATAPFDSINSSAIDLKCSIISSGILSKNLIASFAEA